MYLIYTKYSPIICTKPVERDIQLHNVRGEEYVVTDRKLILGDHGNAEQRPGE